MKVSTAVDTFTSSLALTDDDDEDADDPPMVVRQATNDDWAKFDRAMARKLPHDVIAAIAGMNGGGSNDDD